MFSDAQEVIKWAARIKCTVILDGPSTNDMCGKARPSTTNELLMGLSPQEAHEQADMIIKYISQLRDPACAQYLLARYHLTDKIEDVTNRVFARLLYSGGIHNRDVRKVVLKYLGVEIGLREIRESLRCDRNKVNDFIDRIYSIMDAIHYQAFSDIEDRMVDVGLIERIEILTA